jgi:hypothetical protein
MLSGVTSNYRRTIPATLLTVNTRPPFQAQLWQDHRTTLRHPAKIMALVEAISMAGGTVGSHIKRGDHFLLTDSSVPIRPNFPAN